MNTRSVVRHSKGLFGIVAVYGLVLAGSIFVLTRDAVAGGQLPMWAKVPIVLAPMVPALLIIPWTLRMFRRMDEMQVRHQLEALAGASGATAFLALGYGFLELIGFPHLSMFVVWSVFNAFWIAGVWIQRWRFR